MKIPFEVVRRAACAPAIVWLEEHRSKDLRKGDIFVRNAKCRHVIGVISGFTKVQGKRCAVLPYAGAHIAYLPTGAKDPVNPGQDMGTCVMRLCFPRAVTR